jgi:hypothetical protein
MPNGARADFGNLVGPTSLPLLGRINQEHRKTGKDEFKISCVDRFLLCFFPRERANPEKTIGDGEDAVTSTAR